MVLCTVSLYVLGVVRGEGRRNARRFVHSFDGSFDGLSRLCPVSVPSEAGRLFMVLEVGCCEE